MRGGRRACSRFRRRVCSNPPLPDPLQEPLPLREVGPLGVADPEPDPEPDIAPERHLAQKYSPHLPLHASLVGYGRWGCFGGLPPSLVGAEARSASLRQTGRGRGGSGMGIRRLRKGVVGRAWWTGKGVRGQTSCDKVGLAGSSLWLTAGATGGSPLAITGALNFGWAASRTVRASCGMSASEAAVAEAWASLSSSAAAAPVARALRRRAGGMQASSLTARLRSSFKTNFWAWERMLARERVPTAVSIAFQSRPWHFEGGEKTRVLGGGPVLAPLGENIAFA